MLIIYKIFTLLVYYITLPYTFILHLSGNLKWSQRLGWKHMQKQGTDLWIHASSVGEVRVVEILMHQILKMENDINIYITVTTETGCRRAQEIYGKERVGFLPLDYASAINRFLKSVKPIRAMFVETEIWPNLVTELSKAEIPIFLANGRMSEMSFPRYQKFKSLFGPVLNSYRKILLQSDADRRRYSALGVSDDIVEVIGNLKFDAPLFKMESNEYESIRQQLPFDSEKKIIVAGSIRDDELESILDIYKQIRNRIDATRLILVPRYIENKTGIIEMITNRDLTFDLFGNNYDNEAEADKDIYLVLKMGWLNKLYSVGDIAIVGGTFDGIGGHNILEPVWAGIPAVYGPSVENVMESDAYIRKNNFGRKADDNSELIEIVINFLDGKLSFDKKTEDTHDNRALKTAKIILDGD